MAKIIALDSDGIGERLGIKVGDDILSFDGHPVVDILDYNYYDSMEDFGMSVMSGGIERTIHVHKDMDESIGAVFGEDMELRPIRCRNNCEFCFVNQLPKGMRETLYVKDDDYRMSFVCGNYVTLTNVFQEELERIARLRLSPLYISVHCYDREMKRRLIANPEGMMLFDKIDYLASHGIKMHTQIVMCKGLNDGDILMETLSELAKRYPSVLSVAIVPVGLTKFRDRLSHLEQIDSELAGRTIDMVETFNAPYMDDGGFAFCSDEFYIKAGRDVPSTEFYGDFGQIENGVGLVRQFIDDLDYGLSEVEPSDRRATIYSITGQSFKGVLRSLVPTINSVFPNVDFRVMDVVNKFFGETITVAGLLTGGDIIAQLKGKVEGDVIIPSNMLREFTDTFLDGIKVSELEEALGVRVHVARDGEDLAHIISEVLR